MSSINATFDILQGDFYVSSLNMHCRYWQIAITVERNLKTASVTPDGFFEFNVLPLIFVNATATFGRLIDSGLRDVSCTTLLCYFGDIKEVSRLFQEHVGRCSQVISSLSRAKFQLNEKRRLFATHEVKYRWHIVNQYSMPIPIPILTNNPDKVREVVVFPQPT